MIGKKILLQKRGQDAYNIRFLLGKHAVTNWYEDWVKTVPAISHPPEPMSWGSKPFHLEYDDEYGKISEVGSFMEAGIQYPKSTISTIGTDI